MNDRTLIAVTGSDKEHFLQGLITNDVGKIAQGLVYSALLTPQGKFVADFFLLARGGAIIIDVSSALADALQTKLTMYKLRADVELARVNLNVHRGIGTAPDGALPDPRHDSLGWRLYSDQNDSGVIVGDPVDWDAICVAGLIPQTGVELTPETYILEAGFERLNGVDFRKGCYVGQEITARMKHKTELAKGLAHVIVNGSVPPGTPIELDGKPVGTLFTQSSGRGIAHLRFARANGEMTAGSATVRLP